jgi:hypothetical protein
MQDLTPVTVTSRVAEGANEADGPLSAACYSRRTSWVWMVIDRRRPEASVTRVCQT